MDVKDLRTETALSERNNDGSKYSQGSVALQCNRNKSYHDIGSSPLAKAEPTSVRPCAVIGPDRVLPPPTSNDPYLKKGPLEPWLSPENVYRRPPEYPHKLSNSNPSRNISPRQTFQENMQRIMVPPTYNVGRHNDDLNLSHLQDRNTISKNAKPMVAPEAKYCDVPYAVNTLTNEPKNIRDTEMYVPSVNSPLTRTAPHCWPPGGVNLHTPRSFGTHEFYPYPQYPSCAGQRSSVVPMNRPHRTIQDDAAYGYPDPYYQDAGARFKPCPPVKERYPQPRYEYIGNYPSQFHPPPPMQPKYDISKPGSTHAYSVYPHLKYLDNRVPEHTLEGYQRPTVNQQPHYNLQFRNQVIHPPFTPIPANSSQPKMHPYPPDGSIKTVPSNKLHFDSSSKMYIDYENARSKTFPMADNYFVNEMSRGHPVKNQMVLPNYPIGIHPIPPHQYYRKDNTQIKPFEYMPHYRNFDSHLNNSAMLRHAPQFSPNTLAISPTDSNISNDTTQTQGTSQEDCGYASQSSTASVRSVDSTIYRIPHEYYKRHDFRYSPVVGSSPTLTKSDLNSNNANSKDNKQKQIDVRQFLQMWNEGEEENTTENNNCKEIVIQTGSSELNNLPKQQLTNQEQLYVLGLVNVPSEELSKYEHIQKISKLPENIKGYNNLELLSQFEEAIESSNTSGYKSVHKDYQIISKDNSTKQVVETLPRPLSPLDVEAKISQSVIHKEVGCNFEIRPCSPKILNVEIAAPAQNVLGERVIEKVTNPLSKVVKSPIPIKSDENSNCHAVKRQENTFKMNDNPSCKMIRSPYASTSMDSVKTNYSLQDLEINSGVCYASLPRLDNEIELNFPEVNQQFINANKKDRFSTANKPFNLVDESSLSDTKLMKIDTEKDDIKIDDSDKTFTKLSKYRKFKINDSEKSEHNEMVKAVRTDSVIIKNPENIKNIEDKLLESNGSLPINLSSQLSANHDLPDKTSENNDVEIALDFSLNKSGNDLPIIEMERVESPKVFATHLPHILCDNVLHTESSEACENTGVHNEMLNSNKLVLSVKTDTNKDNCIVNKNQELGISANASFLSSECSNSLISKNIEHDASNNDDIVLETLGSDNEKVNVETNKRCKDKSVASNNKSSDENISDKDFEYCSSILPHTKVGNNYDDNRTIEFIDEEDENKHNTLTSKIDANFEHDEISASLERLFQEPNEVAKVTNCASEPLDINTSFSIRPRIPCYHQSKELYSPWIQKLLTHSEGLCSNDIVNESTQQRSITHDSSISELSRPLQVVTNISPENEPQCMDIDQDINTADKLSFNKSNETCNDLTEDVPSNAKYVRDCESNEINLHSKAITSKDANFLEERSSEEVTDFVPHNTEHLSQACLVENEMKSDADQVKIFDRNDIVCDRYSIAEDELDNYKFEKLSNSLSIEQNKVDQNPTNLIKPVSNDCDEGLKKESKSGERIFIDKIVIENDDTNISNTSRTFDGSNSPNQNHSFSFENMYKSNDDISIEHEKEGIQNPEKTNDLIKNDSGRISETFSNSHVTPEDQNNAESEMLPNIVSGSYDEHQTQENKDSELINENHEFQSYHRNPDPGRLSNSVCDNITDFENEENKDEKPIFEREEIKSSFNNTENISETPDASNIPKDYNSGGPVSLNNAVSDHFTECQEKQNKARTIEDRDGSHDNHTAKILQTFFTGDNTQGDSINLGRESNSNFDNITEFQKKKNKVKEQVVEDATFEINDNNSKTLETLHSTNITRDNYDIRSIEGECNVFNSFTDNQTINSKDSEQISENDVNDCHDNNGGHILETHGSNTKAGSSNGPCKMLSDCITVNFNENQKNKEKVIKNDLIENQVTNGIKKVLDQFDISKAVRDDRSSPSIQSSSINASDGIDSQTKKSSCDNSITNKNSVIKDCINDLSDSDSNICDETKNSSCISSIGDELEIDHTGRSLINSDCDKDTVELKSGTLDCSNGVYQDVKQKDQNKSDHKNFYNQYFDNSNNPGLHKESHIVNENVIETVTKKCKATQILENIKNNYITTNQSESSVKTSVCDSFNISDEEQTLKDRHGEKFVEIKNYHDANETSKIQSQVTNCEFNELTHKDQNSRLESLSDIFLEDCTGEEMDKSIKNMGEEIMNGSNLNDISETSDSKHKAIDFSAKKTTNNNFEILTASISDNSSINTEEVKNEENDLKNHIVLNKNEYDAVLSPRCYTHNNFTESDRLTCENENNLQLENLIDEDKEEQCNRNTKNICYQNEDSNQANLKMSVSSIEGEENSIQDSSFKPRRPLKRSFSDSALNSYKNGNASDGQIMNNIPMIWPPKRARLYEVENSDQNVIEENLCNLIQNNNRRNSVSSAYNEENVSFCILIDNNCIITEENEEEKICFAEIQQDCLTGMDAANEDNDSEVICCSQENELDFSSSVILNYENNKPIQESWLDDVACVETVVSDDIDEDVVVSGQASPTDIEVSECNESIIFDNNMGKFTDEVNFINDETVLGDVCQIEETYGSPHRDDDIHMMLNDSEGPQITDFNKVLYSDKCLEKILSESNSRESSLSPIPLAQPHPTESILLPDDSTHFKTPEDKENIFVDNITLQGYENYSNHNSPNRGNEENCSHEDANQTAASRNIAHEDIVQSCESSTDSVFIYKEEVNDDYTISSSPEVTSTTFEEKSSSILLKITNYNGSRVSEINEYSRNRPRCKFTEQKEYSNSDGSFPKRPLITKAAQKYIPPIKESICDLKVKLPLPQQRLLKLKQLKLSINEPKIKRNNPHSISPKKPKPNFEDVLKNIDKVQIKMHKEKNKKSKNIVPKVVIKKNLNGSHYTSSPRKDNFNPDLTGRKWQPWVFLEKNRFIDNMAIKNKTKAVFSHRKNTYVLAEKFKKYKSVSNCSAKFVISQPNTGNSSRGQLKYTIRLKHTY